MNGIFSTQADPPPERRIDAVCDRFESAWKAGERPVLEDYLLRVGPEHRPALLHQLLLAEWDLVARHSRQINVEDYTRRFEQDTALIHSAYESWLAERCQTNDRALDFPADAPAERQISEPTRLNSSRLFGPRSWLAITASAALVSLLALFNWSTSLPSTGPRDHSEVGEGRWASLHEAERFEGSLLSIWALGELDAICVGQNGQVARTNDGGHSWTSQYVAGPPHPQLEALCFVNRRRGWVVGTDGLIGSTQDGGARWAITNPVESDLRGVCFLNDRVGWAVGEDGVVLASRNGGQTWETVGTGLGPGEHLNGIDFADDQTGCIVGHGGIVLRTENAGNDWEPVAVDLGFVFPFVAILRDVEFASEQVGWIVGDHGCLLQTGDSGKTWQARTAPLPEATFMSAFFLSENAGWIAGRANDDTGVLLMTRDAGETWIIQRTAEDEAIRSVHFSDGIGWAAGGSTRGFVLKFEPFVSQPLDGSNLD